VALQFSFACFASFCLLNYAELDSNFSCLIGLRSVEENWSTWRGDGSGAEYLMEVFRFAKV
jgi:hypothetical protein